jgi:hypothetical protein
MAGKPHPSMPHQADHDGKGEAEKENNHDDFGDHIAGGEKFLEGFEQPSGVMIGT